MRKIAKIILFIFNAVIVSFLSVAAFVFTAPGFIVFDKEFVEVARSVTWTDWMLLSWTAYIFSIAFLPITWISDGSKIKNRYIYLTITTCLILLVFVIVGMLQNDYNEYPPLGCPQFCSKKVADDVYSFCGGDGFYSKGYIFTNNSTHYFDQNYCEWKLKNEN